MIRALLSRYWHAGGSRYLRDDVRYRRHEIGNYTYGLPKVLDWSDGRSKLRIGSYCSIALGVKIMLGGAHHTDWVSTFPFPAYFDRTLSGYDCAPDKGGVDIGNDVWIGTDALILPGVTIGDGAIVGAGAVVTRNVAPYAIVGGNPAQLIRYRFDADVIAALLEIAWWHWPPDKVRSSVPQLLDADVRAFVHEHGSQSGEVPE